MVTQKKKQTPKQTKQSTTKQHQKLSFSLFIWYIRFINYSHEDKICCEGDQKTSTRQAGHWSQMFSQTCSCSPATESVLGVARSPQSRGSADGRLQNTLSSHKLPTINAKQLFSSTSRNVLQISESSAIQARNFWLQKQMRHRTQTCAWSLSGRNQKPPQKHPLSSHREIWSFKMIYAQRHIKALTPKPKTYAVVSGKHLHPCYRLRRF